MKRTFILTTACAAMFFNSTPAGAETFGSDTLIIPMDTDYQDEGMFLAYGLVYQLLLNDIPVHWAILDNKAFLDPDFTASSVDVTTDAVITDHSYRGGPWLISPEDSTAALAIVEGWISSHPTTVVHRATAPFSADVARTLVAAPNIAMFADGNEKIARGYVQAAQIPDSTGSLAWANDSPDMLSPAEVAGTTTNQADGALFDEDGDPVYCQLMSMHWGVNDARDVNKDGPEVVAEVRSFLNHAVHFFAECQAVNAFENDLTNGLFLTTQGFVIGDRPSAVDYYHSDSPFVQIDGTYATVGGSEPAYTLPDGESYKANDIVMLTEAGTAVGVNDVWMTGFLDGACPGSEGLDCGGVGKVSYLGGHEYSTNVPLSTNPSSWGTRVFLNSLFEAPCATRDGQSRIRLRKSGPRVTTTGSVTYTFSVTNDGPTVVLGATMTDTLPGGAMFDTASGGGTFDTGVVTWDLGNLGVDEVQTRELTISLPEYGTYFNTAELTYNVGLNDYTIESSEVVTDYDADSDGDGVIDAFDACPSDVNTDQDLNVDVANCGACGNACTATNGTPGCEGGSCVVLDCEAGFFDCDGDASNGCETTQASLASDDDNCGACGNACGASKDCVEGVCVAAACEDGYQDCNAEPLDGCEYEEAWFATDTNHCGDCDTACTPEQSCINGACVESLCPLGLADCDASGGCETNILEDTSSCGGCNVPCAPALAVAACVDGQCSIASCEEGFEDCDGLATTGCEYASANLASDALNCGACGVVCELPAATSSCIDGSCVIKQCAAGYEDLDGDGANGCEAESGNGPTGGSDAGAGTDPAAGGGTDVTGTDVASTDPGSTTGGSGADAGAGADGSGSGSDGADASTASGDGTGAGDGAGGTGAGSNAGGTDTSGTSSDPAAGADDGSAADDAMGVDDTPPDDGAGTDDVGALDGDAGSASGGDAESGDDAGCGCRTAPSDGRGQLWFLALLGGLFLVRRRSSR